LSVPRSFCHRRDCGADHEVLSLAILDTCVAKEGARFSVKAVESEATVLRVDVDANGVAAGVEGGEQKRGRKSEDGGMRMMAG